MSDRFNLYLIETPGGAYVGCTVRTVQARWSGHQERPWRRGKALGSTSDISDALTVYGKHNCSIQHLATALTPADAAACETLLIAQHGTYKPNGFNRQSKSNYRDQRGRVHWSKVVKPVVVHRDFIRLKRCKATSWPPHPTSQAA